MRSNQRRQNSRNSTINVKSRGDGRALKGETTEQNKSRGASRTGARDLAYDPSGGWAAPLSFLPPSHPTFTPPTAQGLYKHLQTAGHEVGGGDCVVQDDGEGGQRFQEVKYEQPWEVEVQQQEDGQHPTPSSSQAVAEEGQGEGTALDQVDHISESEEGE
eukprot:CAMPEP_0181320986 /NCGR_PEP_ID=MMETSP1101-20121128/18427_1 /TAXON_ID=46948 /ORGANISM="Rhodomonas abbreviata, Strain Caron Lab Isolate" /LENGTH=159 /DNA_ID=CAMNT_0023428749 /DNA_START=629 /DNA_END=1108 /DNA_ORIENTATION=+